MQLKIMTHTLAIASHTDFRTVTGASTRWTFPSSTKISRARKHKAFTSFSRKYSHRFNRSICESSEVAEADAAAAVEERVALAELPALRDDVVGATLLLLLLWPTPELRLSPL